MEIEFDYRLFNPVYWHIDDAFNDPNIRNILIYGGSSASKTYSFSQNLIYNSIQQNNSTLIFRKESTSIDDSVYSDFKGHALFLNEHYKMFRVMDRKIITPTGRFKFRGLDDPGKIKGINQYNKIYFNELSEFEIEDWNEAQRRLRGRPHLQIVADWNPIVETHWIKTELIDKDTWIDLARTINGNPLSELHESSEKKINKAGNTILIRTTYLDNYWIIGSPDGKYGFVDRHTIDNFNRMKILNEEDYRVYALGLWGRIKTGGEFFHAFSRSNCVKKIDFSHKNAIHISVDNNVLPYITVTLYQFNEGKKELTQIHEICSEDPFNTVSKAGEATRLWLEEIGYTDKVFLYGDASTKAGNTIDDEKRSFLDKFIEQLEESYIVEDRVPKSNPSVALSGEFINAIWSGGLPYSIIINESCNKSIHDYENVKKDVNGGILKVRTKNKLTGQTYEEFGHCSDTLRYVAVGIFNNEYIKFSNRRKRNAYQEKDIMNYFNSQTKIEYKHKLVFVMPDCNGKFIMATIGINDHADVLDVIFRDTIDESLIFETIKEKPYCYLFECDKIYHSIILELRKKSAYVLGQNVHAKPHHRISAYESLIKSKFRFIDNYDSSVDYVEFINNIMDYNGKDNYEALNLLSFASWYFQGRYFNEKNNLSNEVSKINS